MIEYHPLEQWMDPRSPLPPLKLVNVDWKKRWVRRVSKVGLSFGLPPIETCPGYAYAMRHCKETAICSKCYARKGRGVMPLIKRALKANFRFTTQPDFVPLMVRQIMSQALAKSRQREHLYIRLHWSGDFYSAEYVEQWYRITSLVQNMMWDINYESLYMQPVHIWVATRAWIDPEIEQALRQWANDFHYDTAERVKLAVRPSAMQLDKQPVHADGVFAAGAGVTTAEEIGEHDCPATINHSSCVEEGCRRCWEGQEIVMYREH